MRAGMERITEAMLIQKAFLSSGSSSSWTALIDSKGSFILGQNANNDDEKYIQHNSASWN